MGIQNWQRLYKFYRKNVFIFICNAHSTGALNYFLHITNISIIFKAIYSTQKTSGTESQVLYSLEIGDEFGCWWPTLGLCHQHLKSWPNIEILPISWHFLVFWIHKSKIQIEANSQRNGKNSVERIKKIQRHCRILLTAEETPLGSIIWHFQKLLLTKLSRKNIFKFFILI